MSKPGGLKKDWGQDRGGQIPGLADWWETGCSVAAWENPGVEGHCGHSLTKISLLPPP